MARNKFDVDERLAEKPARQAKAVTQAVTPIPHLKSMPQFFGLGPFSTPT